MSFSFSFSQTLLFFVKHCGFSGRCFSTVSNDKYIKNTLFSRLFGNFKFFLTLLDKVVLVTVREILSIVSEFEFI